MIDHRLTHRCLLADIASGEDLQSGRPSPTLQTLLLMGFVTRQLAPNRIYAHLTLTDAGRRYLAGLWH